MVTCPIWPKFDKKDIGNMQGGPEPGEITVIEFSGSPLLSFSPGTLLCLVSIFFLASIYNLQVDNQQPENQLALISSRINFSLSNTHKAFVGNKLNILPVMVLFIHVDAKTKVDSGWNK